MTSPIIHLFIVCVSMSVLPEEGPRDRNVALAKYNHLLNVQCIYLLTVGLFYHHCLYR